MPFCDVSKDIRKISKFIEENHEFLKSTNVDKFNQHLLSCTYMEIASFFGFLNVLLGYYIAKYTRDAMCSMCKEEESDPNPDEVKRARQNSAFEHRDKLTKVEKNDFCFWLQYINNLSNGCPTTTELKPENQNPYSRLISNSMCWPRPCPPC